MNEVSMPIQEFLNSYQLDSNQLMWFIGAGASRSANLPTASDLTWDIKKRLYCAIENQTFDSYDLNNEAVKNKIQDYMDSQGYPKLWSQEEYSFYFELAFKDDYKKQQRYIEKALHPERVSLNVGHRIFAALIKMNLVKTVFTTNFDNVVEQAFTKVGGSNLNVFNIEGSYAALDALNNESFPLYVKLHGDFRFRSIKNLSDDLLTNDAELKKCFLTAANRFGMIVSGYSGRDGNVMSMMHEALEGVNPFPKGIFWTVPNIKYVESDALEFIKLAKSKGVQACIVETGTFDECLSKIWRQVPNKANELDEQVKLHSSQKVNIPLPSVGTKIPILRTNMLPLSNLKLRCGAFKTNQKLTYPILNENYKTLPYRIAFCLRESLLYWGNANDAVKVIPNYRQLEIESDTETFEAKDLDNGIIKSFVEEGIVHEISKNNPSLLMRKSGKDWYLVVRDDCANQEQFRSLRQAVAREGEEPITGGFRYSEHSWSECVKIGLQINRDDVYLYLIPDIWVKPRAERDQHIDFLRKRKQFRYNPKSYKLLDAWIAILFGSTRSIIKFSNPKVDDFAPHFDVTTRSAFSRRK